MTKSEYIEEWKKRCRAEWFKDHKATIILERPEVTIINWQKPETWTYGCRFIIHRRWLMVVGDIGEATFEWGGEANLSLNFLGSLDFGYFHSKCEASDSGRKFESWDGDFCVQELKDFLAEDERSEEEKAEILERAAGNSHTSQEWCDFIYNGDYQMGDDDYTLADAGSIESIHAIGMFVGLQMAIEQLKATQAKDQ